MIDNQYFAYFSPHLPEQWEAEDIREANRLSKPLQDWAVVFNILGALGAFLATVGIIARKLKGNALTSTLVYLEITSLALIALGIYLNRLASQHSKGLTEEHKMTVAVEELKKNLKELPVCQSEEELQEKVESSEWKSSLAFEAIENVNSVYPLFVTAYYRPTKDLQPRFMIHEGLAMDHKQRLLYTAYDKRILLHFEDYAERIESFKKFPGHQILNKTYNEKCLKNMKQAFVCSALFLENCLLSSVDLQARKRKLTEEEINFINAQLRALSFKWCATSDKEEKMFSPPLYLEDADTVVIRGHYSEIGDPTETIKSLAPHIKTIKVERVGLGFVDNLELYLPANWNDFQTKLNLSFPGTIIFVDSLTSEPTPLWQESVPQAPNLTELLTDLYEDVKKSGKKEEEKIK